MAFHSPEGGDCMKLNCAVCGFENVTHQAPDLCPVCGSPKEHFVQA